MLLSKIAKMLSYELLGDDSIEVSSLKYAWDADKDSLAVAFKSPLKTNARAVLVERQLAAGDKTFLCCGYGGINQAILRVTWLMIEAGIYQDYEKPFPQTEKGGVYFGKGFEVGEGTSIAPLTSIGENVRIGNDCKIESGVFIGSGTEIGNNAIIRAGAKIGVNCHYHFQDGAWHRSFCGVGRLLIGSYVEIGANTVVQRGSLSDTVIKSGTIIGNSVEIAHDVKIGAGCLIVSQAGICGNAEIGDHVTIYGQAGVATCIKIGEEATILAQTAVTKDVRAGQTVLGMFGRDRMAELRTQAKLRRLIDD